MTKRIDQATMKKCYKLLGAGKLSQAAIAKRLGISRWKVGQVAKQAREIGDAFNNRKKAAPDKAKMAELKRRHRGVGTLVKRAEQVAGVDRDRGGGWNKKSIDEHLAEGTYRRDRHGELGPALLAWKPKPAAKITASTRSQRRWIQGPADERAVRNGCRFNERLAQYVCEFFATFLRHSKGQWAGEAFEPTAWQRDKLLYPLFGWVRPDGTRRLRRSYIELPKKNYKSTTASGIGLYMLCGDEEPGAEVYSLGADKDQAGVVHGEAINMVEASPELNAILKINRSTGTITYPATRSYYRKVSATPKGKHGWNIHCAIGDELHEWYGYALWRAIKYGYRARRQPLQLVITNAGDDLQSVCGKQREKARGILDGTLHDDGFFALICSASRKDAEAEITAVKRGRLKKKLPVAERCNPGLGHVIKKEDLVADIRDAIQTPSELPNLLRLTYGVWATGTSPWLSGPAWQKCRRRYTEDDLAGEVCYGGLDLSQTEDMTAFDLMFPRDDGSYRQLCYFWLPEETIEKRKHLIDYASWARAGHLFVIPGPVIVYSQIEDFIVQHVAAKFELKNVAYDPMYASDLTQRLEEAHDIERSKFPQTIMHFARPTAEYERLVLAGQMHHNGNPVLDWQAGHVQVWTDRNGNKRPSKPKPGDIRKIDGIVGGVMALSRAIEPEEEEAYAGEDAELVFL